MSVAVIPGLNLQCRNLKSEVIQIQILSVIFVSEGVVGLATEVVHAGAERSFDV